MFRDIPKIFFAGFVMFVLVFWLNSYLSFNIFTLFFEVFIGIIIYGFMILILRPKLLADIAKVMPEGVKKKLERKG